MECSGLMIASSTDEGPLSGLAGTGTQKRIYSGKSAIFLIRHSVEATAQKFGNYQGINKAQSFDPKNPCSIDELLARADKLIYEQKQNRRGLLTQTASL